jgi:hypothetical protein
MALAALLAVGQPAARHRITASAHSFEQRFEDLKGTGHALSPVERVVFSVALAGTTTPADH